MKKPKRNTPADILKGQVDVWDGLDVWIEYGAAMSKIDPSDAAFETARLVEIAKAEARLAGRGDIIAQVKASRAKLSKKCAANGRKGRAGQFKTEKYSAMKSAIREAKNRLKELADVIAGEGKKLNASDVIRPIARRHGVTYEALRRAINRSRAEKRGRKPKDCKQ